MSDILTQAGAALQAALDGALTKILIVATGNAVELPPSLSGIGKPLVLSGSIIPSGGTAANPVSPASQPLVTIQTSSGRIVVAIDTLANPLPRGTVAVAIQPGSPPTATILAPTPSQTAQAAQADEAVQAPQAAVAQAVQATTQAPLPPLAVGQIIAALVLPAGDRAPVEENATPSPGIAPVIPVAATGSGTAAPPSFETLLAIAVAAAQAGSSGAPATTKRQAGDPPSSDDEADEQAAGETEQTPGSAQRQTGNPPPPSPAQTGDQADVEAEQITDGTPAHGSPSPPAAGTPFPFQDPVPQATQRFVVLSIVAPPADPGQNAAQAVRAVQVSPASQGQGQSPPVTAIVIAQTLGGQPVLTAPPQTLVVTTPASVSTGTQLTLRPLAENVPADATATATTVPVPYNPLPLAAGGRAEWPALAQLLPVLTALRPESAAALSKVIPRTDGDFVETFVAFATAQKSTAGSPAFPVSSASVHGTIDAATATPVLARTLAGLLSQLHEDLTVSGKIGAPSHDGHWQALSVPVIAGPHLEAIQMFVRRQVDPDETRDDADSNNRQATGRTASTRFLVEISPSHLGPVQLDGLLRPQRDQSLRLDLVVRPETTLTEDQGREIDRLFQTALNAAGLTGGLKVQPGRENFVLPQSDGGGHFSRMA